MNLYAAQVSNMAMLPPRREVDSSGSIDSGSGCLDHVDDHLVTTQAQNEDTVQTGRPRRDLITGQQADQTAYPVRCLMDACQQRYRILHDRLSAETQLPVSIL